MSYLILQQPPHYQAQQQHLANQQQAIHAPQSQQHQREPAAASVAHSIYVGFALIAPIHNQKRYEAVLNEILQFLSTHTSEIYIQMQPGRFISFQALSAPNTTTTDQVVLPLSPLNLHTCYFRLHNGYHIQEGDKKFAQIAWEVLNILKENFPSKIHLHQDFLELCKPIYKPTSITEELRRQISCLISIKDEDRPLTLDELEDAWHILQFAEKIGEQRSIQTCLDLISTSVTMTTLQNFKPQLDLETLRRIIDKNDYTQLNTNRQLAQELLDKLNSMTIGNRQQHHQLSDSLQRQITAIENDDALSIQSEALSTGGYQNKIEKPTSTRMCLFQLAESNDINRVSLILDTLACRSKETLGQLHKKYQLNTKLVSVLKKYCNGDYGFDQQTSRIGTFQLNLVKLMTILSLDYTVYLEYLQNSALEYLCQLIEEGIIFAYEDALAPPGVIGTNSDRYLSAKNLGVALDNGQRENNYNTLLNQNLFKFFKIALDFIELSISQMFIDYVPQVRENLIKIQQRMNKLLQRRENALLKYFVQHFSNPHTANQNITQPNQKSIYNDQDDNDQSEPLAVGILQTNQNDEIGGLSVDQLTDLKGISQGLYEFAVLLNQKLQRIEALQDLSEGHKEKHVRLFYKLLAVDPANFIKIEKQVEQQPYKDLKNQRSKVAINDMTYPNQNYDQRHMPEKIIRDDQKEAQNMKNKLYKDKQITTFEHPEHDRSYPVAGQSSDFNYNQFENQQLAPPSFYQEPSTTAKQHYSSNVFLKNQVETTNYKRNNASSGTSIAMAVGLDVNPTYKNLKSNQANIILPDNPAIGTATGFRRTNNFDKENRVHFIGAPGDINRSAPLGQNYGSSDIYKRTVVGENRNQEQDPIIASGIQNYQQQQYDNNQTSTYQSFQRQGNEKGGRMSGIGATASKKNIDIQDYSGKSSEYYNN